MNSSLGYVRVEQAFPHELADRCRKILWVGAGCDPDDLSTWKKSVIWLPDNSETAFVQASNTWEFRTAFDQLVGKGQWQPRFSAGNCVVRFPANEDTGDTSWRVGLWTLASDHVTLSAMHTAPRLGLSFDRIRVQSGYPAGDITEAYDTVVSLPRLTLQGDLGS